MIKVFLIINLLVLSLKAQPQPVDDFQVESPPLLESPVLSDDLSVPTPQATEMGDPLLEGIIEDVHYNPTGKRDPFLPYLTPLQKMAQAPSVPLEPLQNFALNELKIIGIIWDVGKPKALVQDPGGKSHIIVENSKMGKEFGYVAAIREGEVIVVEQLMDNEGKKSFRSNVLKLSSTKGVAP